MRTILLLTVWVFALCFNGFAAGGATKEESVAKLKNDIRAIGVGADSKIKVKLDDGKKIKGSIAEITDNDFVVKLDDNENQRVPYDRVHSARGHNRHRNFRYSGWLVAATILTGLLYIFSNNRNY